MERSRSHGSLGDAHSHEEQDASPEDEEAVDADGCVRESGQLLNQHFTPNPHAGLPVYMTIHRVRRLILASIDDPYTLDQLKDPRMNTLIVRPLVDRLYDPDDVSVVYCLLANRVQFLREQSYQVHQTVNIARATLCELVAGRVLRRFHEDNPGRAGLLLLANILVAGFEPFQNAPEEILRENRHLQWPVQKRGGYERKLTALEVAIISESKSFLSSSACQRVVDAVYQGRVVYTPLSFVDILPDHYKHKPISLYDPRKAPLLNHYRLIVPRSRSIIEVCQFVVLLVLYILTMVHRNHLKFTIYEILFIVYTAGWVLDEFAAILEHGWHVHTQNLWSFLDITFIVIYGAYFFVRMHGLAVGRLDQGRALDILSIAAPVLLPRIAFNLMPDNMLLISLRAMMRDFTVLTLLAVWCFTGFLLALRWLTDTSIEDGNRDAPDWVTVCKWMLWIWFGLDGTGIERSVDLHIILGPSLMIAFAFLGNTLFLTILVSMLTNTFSKVVEDATAEIQFRRAVLTFEGVKSDAIFAYRPPFNILALLVLLPLKFLLSSRSFHRVNVAAIRVLNAPILLLISVYERQRLWHAQNRRPHSPSFFWNFSGFSPHGDILAVFNADPPQAIVDEIEEIDDLSDDALENEFITRPTREATLESDLRRRRRLSSSSRVFLGTRAA
ncbi:nonselective cation channel [Lepidopterella palustris CBS 459.81]|uniref:Nonselective cation channel n=1 Tax=Lepidopterella palustris CBS 459.81 TaxID=1314670 RepID=A0A8E2DZW2_9PEZI|nr:nonselective cation channel [Lepidopterella palustris CBS 459.81]